MNNNTHNLYYSNEVKKTPKLLLSGRSRFDTWESLARDVNSGRSMNNDIKWSFSVDQDDVTLDNMYIHDTLFSKIIDIYPDEMTKKPLQFEDIDQNKETNNEDQIKAIENFIEDNRLYVTLNKALKLNRKNGACLIVFIFSNDKGSDQTEINKKFIKPLRISKQDTLKSIMIYEKKDIIDKRKDLDGNWEYFTVNTVSGSTTYNASRCVFFNGYYKGEEAERINNDFGYGIANKGLLDAIRNYEIFTSMIPDLLDDAVTTVTKMNNLAEMMAQSGDNPDIEREINRLFSLQARIKSRLKTRLIDANDDFTRQELTNLDKMVDLFQVTVNDLVAKSKIPATKLLGISPSASIGSQSGVYEQEEFYDNVKSEMVLYCTPYWNKVLEIIGLLLGISNRKFKKIRYELPKLKELTEIEKAEKEKLESEYEKIEAETVAIQIENKRKMMELGLTMVDDKLVSYIELGVANPFENMINNNNNMGSAAVNENNKLNVKTSSKVNNNKSSDVLNKAQSNNINSVDAGED